MPTKKNTDYYSAEITAANKELGQSVGEVLRQIGVDFVTNLGDTTWGSSNSDSATCLEEAKKFNKLVTDSLRGETQIWTEGNHETGKLSDSQIYSLIYSHNKGLTQDADHWIEGYGYMDFPNQKVRVISLNTNQGEPGVSDAQLSWFAEIALNMDEKPGWSVLTIGHHPLGYNSVSLSRDCVGVLETFIKEGNCQYIGHFHGHAHSYTINRIRKYVSSGVYEEIDAWEVCIPNACATRTDQYARNAEGDYLKTYYSVGGIDYNRPTTDGERTAFTVVTVCMDEKKIYADDYGIVPPNLREVSYDFPEAPAYTNLIPDAKDTDGETYYGGDYNQDGKNDGYKTETYLSGGDALSRGGVDCTGFMPFDGSGSYVIYLSNVTGTTADTNVRIAFYEDYNTHIQTFNATQFANGGNFNTPLVTTTDDSGNITSIDATAIIKNFKDNQGRTTDFFRICALNIDGNSIITVNQPIE